MTTYFRGIYGIDEARVVRFEPATRNATVTAFGGRRYEVDVVFDHYGTLYKATYPARCLRVEPSTVAMSPTA